MFISSSCRATSLVQSCFTFCYLRTVFIPCSCRATSLVQFWHRAFITHLCSVTLYKLLPCNIHLLQPPCRNHRQPNEDVRRPVQERPSPALFNKPPHHKRRPPGHEALALLLLESCPPGRVAAPVVSNQRRTHLWLLLQLPAVFHPTTF